MSTNFPTSLDTYTVLVDNTDNIIAAHPNDRGDAIEALEAKVGINSSAVTTSHDYLLTHLPGQAQNWDAGAVEIRAETFESDVATGTAPMTIASTTVVTNLNADTVDGKHVAGTNGAGEITTNDGSQTLTNKTLTSPVISTGDINTPDIDGGSIDGATLGANTVCTLTNVDLAAGTVDAITEIDTALKSGSDVTLVTGTKGTTNYTAKWNADGDLVDGYALIDDDSMATASATNIPSAESTKAYVDGLVANYDGTKVFDGNMGAWTDLDLSSYVGSNRALVYLRVKGDAGVSGEILFRTNGDTGEIMYSSGYASGASGGSFPAGGQCYCVVATDSSGIIEHHTWNSVSTAAEIYLIGYIKLI